MATGSPRNVKSTLSPLRTLSMISPVCCLSSLAPTLYKPASPLEYTVPGLHLYLLHRMYPDKIDGYMIPGNQR